MNSVYRKVEESKAVRMRCWMLWVGGWVGGWVGSPIAVDFVDVAFVPCVFFWGVEEEKKKG